MAQATNTMTLLINFILYFLSYRQLGDPGVLRGVVPWRLEGKCGPVAFRPHSFGGFGFVVVIV